MRLYCRAGATILCLAASACGGGPASPSPPSGSENPYRITISAQGAVSPRELSVPLGARVLFVNNDSRRHDMTSDPHPDHDNCRPLNDVGLLQPGQSRESGNLIEAKTCGFHDHENPQVESLTGRIVVR